MAISGSIVKDVPSSKTISAATETVSVVIPCYNEERHIGLALERLAGQYDPDLYEIIVVDGLSEDGTQEVVGEFKRNHPNIRTLIIDNPMRNIPTALNLGIGAAKGSIIARMDAHAAPTSGYIRRCVEVLGQDGVGVVGMPCRVRPGASTTLAQGVACAVSHPFGIGDAKYRLREGGPAQEAVDTVAFACFRKSLWERVGRFNESLLTNEDYDFNYRVRQTGSHVILDRSGHCDYFARSTLSSLVRQYARYGVWKARMIKLHPRSIKVRHLVAPLFVVSVLLFGVLGFLWRPLWWALAAELVIYFLLGFAFAYQAVRNQPNRLKVWLVMPMLFLTIHVAWGASFLFGLLGRPR